ncbi:hypothetical protein PIB30_100661 [Stylosanthes scabra]|uniref:Transposase MuDR plant domain-containing protein n=1 Tax=Stylosanthes scabra TaxID=79078 RepID=A0ABU6RXD0_9FABA|nr:hypothetical protein [Stylosanthes scabra]
MPRDVRSLAALKNFVAHAIGLQDTKRATKIYYRYPMEVDGSFQFKRYRLRDDDDVKLIRGGSANAGDDTQSAGPASRNIRRMMFNLNESPGGSNEGLNYRVDSEPLQGMLPEEFESHEGSATGDPMTESFHLDPDQDDGGDEVEEELNSLRISQVSLAQPAISQSYEYPDHFSTLNLDAMNSDVRLGQGGPDDDPTAEFEVGQQFENKEEVLMAVKTYSIRRAVQFKILESDQLKYDVRCAEFGKGCEWNIRVSYRRK